MRLLNIRISWLEELIRSECTLNKKLYYIQNGGNAGDALITAPLILSGFFNIVCHYNNEKPIDENIVIFYSGGGNLINQYSQAREVLELLKNEPKIKFYLLPHTVRGNEELLRSLDNRFHFIAREDTTFQFLSGLSLNCEISQRQDLALELTEVCSKLIKIKWKLFIGMLLSKNVSRERKQQFGKFVLKLFLKSKQNISNEKVYLFRSDVEISPLRRVPNGISNFDLSGAYSSNYKDPMEVLAVSSFFLWFVFQQKRTIVTDRLHVAIAAHLVGRQVELYDNSYGKNKSVYETSLKTSPYVKFISYS